MGLVVTTAPATEPLSLDEAKDHLRVDIADHDTRITALIVSARECVERVTGRALITQTLTLTLDAFPCDGIELPRAPVSSITSVTYKDTSGATQTLDTAAYQYDLSDVTPRIVPAPGYVWPSTEYGRLAAVTVVYVAGYGAASAVPASLKHAMRLIIGTLFAFGEDVISGTIVNEIPTSAALLMSRYRLPSVLFAA